MVIKYGDSLSLLDLFLKSIELYRHLTTFYRRKWTGIYQQLQVISTSQVGLKDRILEALFGTFYLNEFEDLESSESLESVVLTPEVSPMPHLILFQINGSARSQSPQHISKATSDNYIKSSPPKGSEVLHQPASKRRMKNAFRMSFKRLLRFLFLKPMEYWERIFEHSQNQLESETTNSPENRFKT